MTFSSSSVSLPRLLNSLLACMLLEPYDEPSSEGVVGLLWMLLICLTLLCLIELLSKMLLALRFLGIVCLCVFSVMNSFGSENLGWIWMMALCWLVWPWYRLCVISGFCVGTGCVVCWYSWSLSLLYASGFFRGFWYWFYKAWYVGLSFGQV